MVTRSMSKLAAAAGGLALATLAGAGIASADELSPAAINTTCNYNQVMQALQQQSPDAAAQFNSSGRAKFFLNQYLGSAPPQRVALAQQAQAAAPDMAQRYIPLINQVAVTCNNF
ncbi:MAG TPA: hemophore-related protein [Mycobacterium sp.]|jgi:hemophore-related protein|uniref:hemophore-related protein n=1 Tax=Mycobacterium sp. TaxID=1785 RepID=UPI002F3ED73A